jgi:hypothetical protein
MKFLDFFLLLWIIFALLDPDTSTDPNPESGYGSTDLIESGSETLPIGSYCYKKSKLPGMLNDSNQTNDV